MDKQNEKEERYIKNLDAMMEKSKQRRENLMQQYKNLSKSTDRSPSPLYKRIEEQYTKKKLLPELDRRSEILAKRKLEY